jgi:protein Tex
VVKVRVVDVDIARKRIGLSMRREPAGEGGASTGARKKAGGEARVAGKPSDRPPSPKEQATGALGAALLNALKTR